MFVFYVEPRRSAAVQRCDGGSGGSGSDGSLWKARGSLAAVRPTDGRTAKCRCSLDIDECLCPAAAAAGRTTLEDVVVRRSIGLFKI